ncbi:4-hydroxy-2-oxoglutarate aldolase [Purpureocillium takamizusanense]|uniref:4-hydroxy-2-oxoglutarate aldolase n=1 Tax=Purpureocillium takamizusanense TaxID=2060973 RepID=A0A9Q8QHB9_9HYPO|nr:4-hydroxy-2-oxoglutarate aldolase [Purpureocillium takamizusanense]UNI19257.1 4-hydroxy-2-oxoglutarate aldolase [Purpureocillium takamizusanense]
MSFSMSPPPFGVYAPVVCFFTDDEDIDFPSITHHVQRLLASGVRGLVVHGSNGEATHLSQEERLEVIRHVRTLVKASSSSDAVIISGCSANSVRETRKLVQDAQTSGADFALVLPPSYWIAAMTKPVIKDFYLQVAASSSLPVLIYNFPGVTGGIDLDSDMIIDLARERPAIVGVKLTCGNLGKLQRISATLPSSQFAAFAGKADFMLPGLVAGSNGVISALANVVPRAHVELARLYKAGELQEAITLQNGLSLADWELSKSGISGVKTACQCGFGYGTGNARKPLPTVISEAFSLSHQSALEGIIAVEKQLACRMKAAD